MGERIKKEEAEAPRKAARGLPGGSGQALRSSGQAEVLTSRDNKWLKEFRVTLRGGLPSASGAVGVEGVRLVEEALTSGCRVEAVLFSESGEKHRERLAGMISRREMAFPVLRTTDRLFEGIADTEHPQGVAALVVPMKFEIADIMAMPEEECEPLLMVLAGVQDPGNVGTILRTAAAFGATGVVTAATGQSGTASPFAPKALRASAGAALHVPIVTGMALGILLTQLRLNGIRTVATCVRETHPLQKAQGVDHPRESKNKNWKLENRQKEDAPTKSAGIQASATGAGSLVAPWEVDWTQAWALLVGNEGAGLPEDIVSTADVRVHVPMAREIESLNAAAAAAVLMYEAFRQRRKAVASDD